jgi:hypothetical protein
MRNTFDRATVTESGDAMTGLGFVAVTVAAVIALVLVARGIDRLRRIDTGDRWAGWYRGKSNTGGKRLGNGPEYDSMDDHGNREADGGL